MSREYPERPIVGVGAVVWRSDRVLLIRRGKPPRLGQWSLPGGAVETGEPLEEAIIREVREETGLDVIPVQIAVIFERIIRDADNAPEYHYLLVDFLCRQHGGTLCAGDDSNCAKWFHVDELDRVSLTEGTLEVIRRVQRSGPSLTVLRPSVVTGTAQ